MAVSLALGLALAAGSGTAESPLSSKPTLHTPDTIAPAVLPYLACLYATRGLPLLSATDGTQVSFDDRASDCSAARARAKSEAAKLLRGKASPESSNSETFIERTLDDMDRYVAGLPAPQGHHSGAVIGIPVTIEDELKPAYDRYDQCLKTQVSGSAVTAGTVVAAFQRAQTVCRSIRDLAVVEANAALIAKGWDADKRSRAAENTFAKIDESWLAMGRQYEDELARRDAALRKPDRPADDSRR